MFTRFKWCPPLSAQRQSAGCKKKLAQTHITVLEQLQTGMHIQGELKPFTSELTEVDGILLKGSKIVVPKTMRVEILRRIHEGHLGQNKCRARTRRLVFWPGLGNDIENLVRTCHVCQKYSYSQPSEPLLLRPAPERPWYRVGIDMLQFARGLVRSGV